MSRDLVETFTFLVGVLVAMALALRAYLGGKFLEALGVGLIVLVALICGFCVKDERNRNR